VKGRTTRQSRRLAFDRTVFATHLVVGLSDAHQPSYKTCERSRGKVLTSTGFGNYCQPQLAGQDSQAGDGSSVSVDFLLAASLKYEACCVIATLRHGAGNAGRAWVADATVNRFLFGGRSNVKELGCA